MNTAFRLSILTKNDYGKYSSYYNQFYSDCSLPKKVISPCDSGLSRRIIGKAFSWLIRAKPRNQYEAYAELKFLYLLLIEKNSLFHIANIEDHIPLLNALTFSLPRLLATIHYPPAYWRPQDLPLLAKLGKLITLCTRDYDFFSSVAGPGKVELILHGVDTCFFRPSLDLKSRTPHIIFVGKWLRDFETAGQVLRIALDRWPSLSVDIIVQKNWAGSTALTGMECHPRVNWMQAVSDEKLLQSYQKAWFLLMPLYDTSANNALVEALSCGVIPLVNRVGGVTDYGADSVYPSAKGGKVSDYLNLLESYLSDISRLDSYSGQVRSFAEIQLDWSLITRQHNILYHQLVHKLCHALDRQSHDA